MANSRITMRREAARGEQLHGKQTLSSKGVCYKLNVAETAGAIPAAAAMGYTHFRTKRSRWRPIAEFKSQGWGGASA